MFLKIIIMAVILIGGILLIIGSFAYTKEQHQKEKLNLGVGLTIEETVIRKLISLILNWLPWWVSKIFLFIFGLIFFSFGLFLFWLLIHGK